MAISIETLALAKKYADTEIAGAGAIKGAPATIKSITKSEGVSTVTFEWEDKNGNTQTETMTVADGAKGDTGAKGDKGDIGPTVTVDSVMSDTSTNAVQNKVIKKYVDDEITELNEDIAEETYYRIYGKKTVPIVWSQGGISGSGTNSDSYTKRIRTNDYYDFNNEKLYITSDEVRETFQLIFYRYTKEKTFVDSVTVAGKNFPAEYQTDNTYLYRLCWLDSKNVITATSDMIGIVIRSEIKYVPEVISTNIKDTVFGSANSLDVDIDSYSNVCVHHDNFSRTMTNWEMGQNSGSTYDVNNYEYVSARTYDDGFRVNNGLTCSANSSRTNAFSLRKVKATHSKQFMFEFSTPALNTVTGFAWDIKDVSNFKLIQFDASNNYIEITCKDVVNNSYKNVVVTKKIYKTNSEIISVYFVGGHCIIYFDDQCVLTFDVVPFTTNLAICSYKSYSLGLKFLNVFDLSNHITFNPNYIIDRNITDVPSTTLSANANRYSLDSSTTRWSNYSEHFSLQSTDEKIYHGIRTERSTESLVDNNLRTVNYEFDVMFPEGFGFDIDEANYHDTILQFHDRESDLTTRGDVCFYLAVIADKLTVYMSSTTEPLSTDVTIRANFEPILEITEGKWYHIEIYQRERYDENQHPFTSIKINGEVVWQSRKPNCYNDRRGSGLQYGIYKNFWSTITEMERYFDNVKVIF